MTNSIDGTKELMAGSILLVILEYKIITVFFHRKISIVILRKHQVNCHRLYFKILEDQLNRVTRIHEQKKTWVYFLFIPAQEVVCCETEAFLYSLASTKFVIIIFI